MIWRVVFTRQAMADARKLRAAGLKAKGEKLLLILADDPFQTPPPSEKLVGDLAGAYSRRLSRPHRPVSQVLSDERVARALRMWVPASVTPNPTRRIEVV